MAKVIIAGGRDFTDYKLLRSICSKLLKTAMFNYDNDPIEIVSGNANGADKLGEKFAGDFDLQVKKFPADWNKHGKSAGYIRNKQMAEYAQVLIAFWDGTSKGTKMMIDLAHEYELEVRVIKY